MAEMPQTLGLSYLAQQVHDDADLTEIWDRLIAAASADPGDPGAMLDISIILQLKDQVEQGLEIQAQALANSPIFRRIHGDGSGLRVLALMAPGGFMANTPVDFLLEGSNCELLTLYVGSDVPALMELPGHDVVLLAVGESDANRPTLNQLAANQINTLPKIVNGAPAQISALTRDGVSALFTVSENLVSPATARLSVSVVSDISHGPAVLSDHLPGTGYPIIIRPVDSHAGQALEKIDDPDGLVAYLFGRTESEFFLSAFVDYSDPDGLFRKQRIAFINGQPFASHMAISDHWMVHYLSADMAIRAERRVEEAEFMETFDSAFAVRHAAAFVELTTNIGLDYFAIDCAETTDGKLLLFEADVAMLIHAMDSAELYPYKKPAMRKLFAAFQAYLALVAA